ncbi:MAG: FHA domain-containing protein [Planctomycetes bacterium]|nr:FHA domain-containing protein [Planctomycetota bacterium]MCW8141174.1 FHA domain-containing protein [Planctomycetota bacterium]
MIRLDEFLRQTAPLTDAAGFALAYPHPALTLRVPTGAPAAPAKQVSLNDTLDDEGVMALLGDPLDRTHVAFLLKSQRNPFGNIISVGRAASNDVCIDHSSVSKVHAVFTCVGASWKVSDRKAKNGLYVNRVQLDPGASAPLEDGALIALGTQVEGTFHTPRGLWAFLELVRMRERTRR